jgi:hypothetical protein
VASRDVGDGAEPSIFPLIARGPSRGGRRWPAVHPPLRD